MAMARTQIVIDAPPDAVWQVLAEPEHYGHWVVGSSEVRDWDADWPLPGRKFHHRVGFKPFTLSDHTECVEADPPWRLVLRAKARPLGAARVQILLDPQGEGTLVTMIEDPDIPLGGLLTPPPVHLLIRLRNAESLRRLKRLAEERSASAGTPARPRQPAHSPA